MAVEREDIRETGQSIFFTKILPRLPDSDKGKTVVLDVDSGDYEVDAVEARALERLLSRRPEACTWTAEFQVMPEFRASWRMTHGKSFLPLTPEEMRGMREMFISEGWRLDD